MSFADPTLAAAVSVWGEIASLLRDPAVTLTGVYAAPDALRPYGGVSVDTIDAALTVASADIAGLAITPGEAISVRGVTHYVVAVLEDDGAGTAILLRRRP